MAYRLKRKESVSEGLKRIVWEETGSAITQLRGSNRTSADSAVHEVRKSIKKTRAILRLVRPELGDLFDQENTRLRDAGQKLSDIRDAGALIGAFDQLRSQSGKKLAPGSIAPIRHRLVVHKKRVETELGGPKVMDGLVAELGQVRKSVKRWSGEVNDFDAIAPGFEQTFRQGRKALATAKKSGSREDFHEWRKRVKDHWYHIRLLERLWTEVMEGYEHSLKDLEDALGDDLNLAILRERILAGESGRPPGRIVKAIEDARKGLRERALEIGDRVYAEKPRQLTKHIGQLWKAWRTA